MLTAHRLAELDPPERLHNRKLQRLRDEIVDLQARHRKASDELRQLESTRADAERRDDLCARALADPGEEADRDRWRRRRRASPRDP